MKDLIPQFLLLLSLTISAQSQDSKKSNLIIPREGIPDIQQIFENHQVWDVMSDDRGIMYVVSTGKLWEYDGVTQSAILNATIRCLAKNTNGRIYAGGVSEFGFLNRDARGKTTYQSLTSLLPSDTNVDQIERIYIYDDKAYFAGNRSIYQYDEEKDSIIAYDTKVRAYPLFEFEQNVYATLDNKGIFRLNEGKLEEIGSNYFFENIGATSIISYPKDSILLLASTFGALLHDGTSYREKKLSWTSLIKDKKLYDSRRLSDDFWAFYFLEGGLLITDIDLNPVAHWDKSVGLVDQILSVRIGAHNDLWVCSNNGIYILDLNTGVASYNEESGLSGLVSDIVEFDNSVIVSTFDGVFTKTWNNGQEDLNFDNPKTFTKIEGSGIYTYDLLPVDNGFFVNAYQGVAYIEKGKYNVLEEKVSSYGFVKFSPDSSKIIATGSDGREILVFSKSAGQWKLRNKIDTDEYSSILNVTLYLGWDEESAKYWSYSGDGIATMTFDEEFRSITSFRIYGEEDGLPSQKNAKAFLIDGEILSLISHHGLYKYDRNEDQFIKDNRFDNYFDKKGLYRLTKQDDDHYWYASNDGTSGLLYRNGSDEKFQVSAKPLNSLAGNKQVFASSSAGQLMGGFDGLHVISDVSKVDVKMKYPPMVRGIQVIEKGTDSIIYLTGNNQKNVAVFNSIKSIQFKFAAPYYLLKDELKYSLQLEGFDNSASEWSTKTEKEYTNLPHGSYKLKIWALNGFSEVSSVGTYPFEVLPPWYFTYWAYTLYLLLLVSVIWTAVRINSIRLKRENEKLENIILERTEEIRYQAEKLKTLDNAKSRFFANISHELRTPLTLIQGPLESVLNGSLGKVSDSIKSNLDLSRKSTRKLLNLVEEILDLSKLEAGKLDLKLEAVKLHDLINRIFFTYQSLAQTKKIAMDLDFKVDEQEIVKVDVGKLEKILDNLLSNALKFTAENGVIRMTVLAGSEQLKVSVEDNGAGIDKEELEQIFDRFYQAGKENKYAGGTGIGLALAKELAGLMQGSLVVESTLGQGTMFTLSIPFVKAESEEIKIYEELVDEKGDETKTIADPLNLKSARILVVEDHEEMRAFIKKELGSYKVDEASDGLEGLKMVKNNKYDLIITDLMMPKIDGMELVANLKMDENTSHLSIIMLTARAADEDKIEGLTLGIDDYIVKPFNPDELRVRVGNLLTNRISRQEELAEESPSSADDQLIMQLKELVSDNLKNSSFNVATLADEAALSERQLNRTIKRITGLTAGAFVREVRLNAARVMLEKRTYNTIAEVCYACGFEKPGYFTEIYSKRFGKRPVEYLS